MLLEDVVNEDLKEDEEKDDDKVALLQQEAALCPARRLTPQRADAPANTAAVSYEQKRSGSPGAPAAPSPTC